MKLVYTSKAGALKIYLAPGKKGPRDFIVHVQTRRGDSPPFTTGQRGRPLHIDWVNLYRDFYRFSHTKDPRFSEGVLAAMPHRLATSRFVRPTAVDLPSPRAIYNEPFTSAVVDAQRLTGQYEQAPLDFILAMLELIFVQEVTNYPKGVLHILLTKMLRDELLSALPGNAARAGETPQSLQNAVTSLAVWKKGYATRQLFNKWRGFYGV